CCAVPCISGQKEVTKPLTGTLPWGGPRRRYICVNEPVGAPSAPVLLKFLLLPNEMSWPELVAPMPAPLRVTVSSLSTMVARGPSPRDAGLGIVDRGGVLDATEDEAS